MYKMKGAEMNNEVWHKIMSKYVDCYNAINTLIGNRIIEKDRYDELRFSLLADIIVTFESEIKD